MRNIFSLLFLASLVICNATFAAEPTQQNAVEGAWSLTKTVDGIMVDERSSQSFSRTPEGVGFVYLDGGEFKVPGEPAGSKRYTDLKRESEIGFATEKRQVDGRYKIRVLRGF